MSLPEGLNLVHRDNVPNQHMLTYRRIMAPTWFPNDTTAQNEYANLPGNPDCGNIIQNLCLVDHHGNVKGTISLYSFKYHNDKELLTDSGLTYDLVSCPSWLAEFGYIGDNSLTPDIAGKGIMTELVQEMIARFPHAFIVGITGKTNRSMIKVFTKTGAVLNDRRVRLIKSEGLGTLRHAQNDSLLTTTSLYIKNNYPPVVHLFHNKSGILVCGAISSTPNHPYTGQSQVTEKYPNQIVGLINPNEELDTYELNDIFSVMEKFKYYSLFQLGDNLEGEQKRNSGDWVTALYKY